MPTFNFIDLSRETRDLMLSEVLDDIAGDRLYISDRLNDAGKEKYAIFLINAITRGDDETFKSYLDAGDHFAPTYIRQGSEVAMPSNAAQLLSQGEFNRYYIRAICLKALHQNMDMVEIYRGRESSAARSGSEARIGQQLPAKDLLDDLRSAIGTAPQYLPEVNSGLCIKLIETPAAGE